MKMPEKQHGFSLTELAVVLVIVGLIMASMMNSGTAFIEIQQRKTTAVKLAAVEVALASYVAVNGRLPCPADGSLLSSNASAGVEHGSTGGCTANQINGVVPWATIGLPEATATDEWNMRFSYRVGNHLWVARGMDMTSCDPAGSEAVAATPKLCSISCASSNLTTCTPPAEFLQAGKGILVQNATASGNTLMNSASTPSGGAAYVLISHGKNAAGAFPIGGGAVTGAGSAGTDEVTNSNGVAINFATPTFFVDRDISDAIGTTHFDDILIRPSIMSVLQKAQRGPRAH